MSGSFLILGAAMALGADATPPAPPPPPPVAPITVSGTGCGGCGAPAVWSGYGGCDTCGSARVSLLDRLRARFAGWGRHECAPACAPVPSCMPAPTYAPVSVPAHTCGCGAPLFTGFTTSCADPCERQGLLARLRARFGGHHSCDACAAPLPCGSCGSSVGGCTSGYGTVLTPPPGGGNPPPPDKMPVPGGDPKKDQPKKDEPKKDEPKKDLTSALPTVDAPRVPTLGGTSGKY